MADENDDVMADVRAAMQENAGEQVERPEAATPDPAATAPTEPPASGRERDEAGRFKAKEQAERPILALKEKPAEPQPSPTSTPATPPAATTTEQPKTEPIAPPAEWKGAGKVKWDRLPREVQTELRDTWQALAAERAEVAPFRELIDSHKQLLVNETGSVQAGMTQLFAFARMSVDNPVQLIQHIAAQRGIDLRAAFAGQPQPGPQQSQPGPTADVAQLVQQALQPILGQFQQQSLQQEIQKIEAFRADPKHPYFTDVAPRIEQLLKAGAAKDLQDAYDQAVWADPTIRQQLMAAQAEEAKKTQAAEVEKATKARAASLRGSPLPGASPGGGSQSGSVFDDVRAAAAELAGT